MIEVLRFLAGLAADVVRRRAGLVAENALLRQQLIVTQRKIAGRPVEWVKDRLGTLQVVLERQAERSGLILRRILGPVRLVPVRPDIGRPLLPSQNRHPGPRAARGLGWRFELVA
jgi:hypothetical protein